MRVERDDYLLFGKYFPRGLDGHLDCGGMMCVIVIDDRATRRLPFVLKSPPRAFEIHKRAVSERLLKVRKKRPRRRLGGAGIHAVEFPYLSESRYRLRRVVEYRCDRIRKYRRDSRIVRIRDNDAVCGHARRGLPERRLQ